MKLPSSSLSVLRHLEGSHYLEPTPKGSAGGASGEEPTCQCRRRKMKEETGRTGSIL